jgi:hypothetical protein
MNMGFNQNIIVNFRELAKILRLRRDFLLQKALRISGLCSSSVNVLAKTHIFVLYPRIIVKNISQNRNFEKKLS